MTKAKELELERTTSRRQVLLAGVGLIAAPAILSRPALGQGRPINFLTWGGRFGAGVRAGFSDPFTTSTGVTVNDVTPYNYGRFVTAMQNNNPENFDLAWFADEIEPARAGAMGLVEKLDYSLMPNASKALASARTEFGVSPYVTTYQVGYRTDRWSTAPQSWADFWDIARFPGARSLGTNVMGVLEAALMADSVAPSALYPLDEARAYRKLNQIKPHIRVFHNTSAAQPARQQLYQGEIAMILSWSSDFIAQKVAKRPIDVIWNGGFYFSPLVGIAKGSPYVRQAHAYLDQFFQHDRVLAFAKTWPTTPVLPSVAAALTEEERSLTAAGNLDKMVNLDRAYYLAAQTALQERYDAWRVL
jgi:putative spermidine/putrescine transport system substrate-binding protein